MKTWNGQKNSGVAALALSALLCTGWAQAQQQQVCETDRTGYPASTAGRFTGDGAEVTDTTTGLVWARCSVGQTFEMVNGKPACTTTDSAAITAGYKASRMSHEQALAKAEAATDATGGTSSGATAKLWRLPTVTELRSLVQDGCVNPAIDAGVFPNTVSSYYRTSSPNVGSSYFAWGVSFYDGYVGHGYRYGSSAVRLVRRVGQ